MLYLLGNSDSQIITQKAKNAKGIFITPIVQKGFSVLDLQYLNLGLVIHNQMK